MKKKLILLLLLLHFTISIVYGTIRGGSTAQQKQPKTPVPVDVPHAPSVNPPPVSGNIPVGDTNVSMAGISEEQKKVLDVVAASAGIGLTAAIVAYKNDTNGFKNKVDNIVKSLTDKYGNAKKWTGRKAVEANNFIADQVKDVRGLNQIFIEKYTLRSIVEAYNKANPGKENAKYALIDMNNRINFFSQNDVNLATRKVTLNEKTGTYDFHVPEINKENLGQEETAILNAYNKDKVYEDLAAQSLDMGQDGRIIFKRQDTVLAAHKVTYDAGKYDFHFLEINESNLEEHEQTILDEYNKHKKDNEKADNVSISQDGTVNFMNNNKFLADHKVTYDTDKKKYQIYNMQIKGNNLEQNKEAILNKYNTGKEEKADRVEVHDSGAVDFKKEDNIVETFNQLYLTHDKTLALNIASYVY